MKLEKILVVPFNKPNSAGRMYAERSFSETLKKQYPVTYKKSYIFTEDVNISDMLGMVDNIVTEDDGMYADITFIDETAGKMFTDGLLKISPRAEGTCNSGVCHKADIINFELVPNIKL